MNKVIAIGCGATLFSLAMLAKDPIIMTVNGVGIPQSEFEYLYKKNVSQQMNPQTLDDYLEMFKLYKLKVAEARAAQVDTSSSFKKEMAQYRHDLAAPYMTDSVYLKKLLHEAYLRSQEEVEARHIMLFKTQSEEQNAKLRTQLDSIREALLSGSDFAEMAKLYSQDRGSIQNGGSMGFINAGMYPYNFETAAYTTPVGKISEIVESPVGYHVLIGGEHRPARGEVYASHILKLVQDPATNDEMKQRIDSIYNLVTANPTEFAKVAKAESDDPGSGSQGGQLPWFGTGQMVPEFDSVAFSLSKGEISKPFRTQFGWHIILLQDKRTGKTEEEMKPAFIARVTSPQDDRYALIIENQTRNLAKSLKGKINDKTRNALRSKIAELGLNTESINEISNSALGKQTLYSIGGKATSVADFLDAIRQFKSADNASAPKMFDMALKNRYHAALVSAEEARLEREVVDYRNLLKEYEDGSLLYEISLKNVWNRANEDTEGLKNYFEKNRANYKWSAPRAKGYLVQTVNDSIANEVRQAAVGLGQDTLVNTLRKRFGSQIQIDRVLADKGLNAMVDHLMFGGQETKPSRSKFKNYFMLNGRLISKPEEMEDAKGEVVNDYQNELQSQWEAELLKKYEVVVDNKVLKNVKKRLK